MNRIISILLILLSGIPAGVMAQKSDTLKGSLEINQDMRVNVLLDKHQQMNQAVVTTEGYRIQLFFDSGNASKARAQSVADAFAAQYPAQGVYVTFKSPNYRVRAGDFRSHLDAQRFLNQIVTDYPNAFIITDQVNISKLNP